MGVKMLLLSFLAALPLVHSWPKQTYHTENFVAPGLKVNRTGGAAADTQGLLFYGVIGGGYIGKSPIIMQSNGELVFYGGNVVSLNNKVQSYQGQDVMTYWSGFRDGFGHGYGRIDVFDKTYTLIQSVCLNSLNFKTPDPEKYPGNRTNFCYFDHHESFFTNRGTVIATAYNVTQTDLRSVGGKKDGWIFDSMFVEVEIATNKVLFVWSALDHVPVTKSYYRGLDPKEPLKFPGRVYGNSQRVPWDYFHINSVQPIDGGYLVSSRFFWSIYKVNGKTGNIEWTLEGNHGGDFSLAPGTFWSWQHDPRMQSMHGNKVHISMFNNDNIHGIIKLGVNQSAGLLVEVDMKTKKAHSVRNLIDNKAPLVSAAQGNYQKLANGNVLVGYGRKGVVREFNSKNHIVYEGQFAPLLNPKGHDDSHSYRIFRQSWDGAQPTYPPKAAGISATGGNVKVYMSWNGATTVDSWNVYAGPTADNVSKVASAVPKKGFETETTVKSAGSGALNYVQAEALGNGQSLGKSQVVKVQSK